MKPLKICPQVYQVGGSNLSHPDDCCVYLLESEGELALIDAGAGKGSLAFWKISKALVFLPLMFVISWLLMAISIISAV
jgi:hypothetical protein